MQRGGGAEMLKAEVLVGRLLQLPSEAGGGATVTVALDVFPLVGGEERWGGGAVRWGRGAVR